MCVALSRSRFEGKTIVPEELTWTSEACTVAVSFALMNVSGLLSKKHALLTMHVLCTILPPHVGQLFRYKLRRVGVFVQNEETIRRRVIKASCRIKRLHIPEGIHTPIGVSDTSKKAECGIADLLFTSARKLVE